MHRAFELPAVSRCRGTMNNEAVGVNMHVVDAAWQEWLATNVSLGCTPESMIEAMVQAGFDAAAARDIVGRAAAEGGVQAAAISPVDDSARAYHYDACPVAAGNRVRAHDRDVTVLM